MTETRDLLVDTPNPGALDATLRELPGGDHLLTGEVVDGHQVVRTTNPGFARYAIEQQGYATVVGWRDDSPARQEGGVSCSIRPSSRRGAAAPPHRAGSSTLRAVASADIDWVLDQVRGLHDENRYTDTQSTGAYEGRQQLLRELEDYLEARRGR